MPETDKYRFVAALNHLREQIIELKQIGPESPEFSEWRSAVIKILHDSIGPAHPYSVEFSKLEFKLPDSVLKSISESLSRIRYTTEIDKVTHINRMPDFTEQWIINHFERALSEAYDVLFCVISNLDS